MLNMGRHSDGCAETLLGWHQAKKQRVRQDAGTQGRKTLEDLSDESAG